MAGKGRRRATAAGATAAALALLLGGALSGCDKSVTRAAKPGSDAATGATQPSGQHGSSPALALLDTLKVAAKGTMSGYDRDAFGPAWTDDNDDLDGHNHCDTRDDILTRDLTGVTYKSGHCVVATGTLDDPYTGKTIHFVRGPKSTVVQIDHVVPLGDAWTTGARQLSATQRRDLAEDPLELLAVDGPANGAKSDSDASAWLPPEKDYACFYVARQVAVKAKYHLWVTPTEKAAMTHTLDTCPTQPVPTDTSRAR